MPKPARDYEDVVWPRYVQRRRAATTMTVPQREAYDEGRAHGIDEAVRIVEPLLIAASGPRPDDVEVAGVARAAHAELQRLTPRGSARR